MTQLAGDHSRAREVTETDPASVKKVAPVSDSSSKNIHDRKHKPIGLRTVTTYISLCPGVPEKLSAIQQRSLKPTHSSKVRASLLECSNT